MRKMLLMLAVGGAALAASAGVKAMPVVVSNLAPGVSASVQDVQYYRRDFRRDYGRHERWRHRHYRHHWRR